MDVHQTIVTAALAAKSSAEAPKNACREVRSEEISRESIPAKVAQPFCTRRGGASRTRSRSAQLGSVEPLVGAPEAVQPACIRRVGVVDDAVLEHERAQARPIARVRGGVGSACRRKLGSRLGPGVASIAWPPSSKLYSTAPLRCCSSVNETPKSKLKSPPSEDAQGNASPSAACTPAASRAAPARRPEHHVMVGQVHNEPVEPVRDRRAVAGSRPCSRART